MVKKTAENGTFYHEPPYTEEEELELYARINHGPFTFLHGQPPSEAPSTLPPHKLPQRPAGK